MNVYQINEGGGFERNSNASYILWESIAQWLARRLAVQRIQVRLLVMAKEKTFFSRSVTVW